MARTASAPGKVVVSGEYAVLEDAPAIVMAVDRRARVHVSSADGDWHRLSLPGLGEGELAFRVDEAGEVSIRDDQQAPTDLSLLGRVWRTIDVRAPASLKLEIDTRPFFHQTRRLKLGLGSSAALAVALTAALLPEASRPRDLVGAALAAHRAWQAGCGSGVDVAAAVRGGLFAYRASGGVEGEGLYWPKGLQRALLWTGRPARTADRVARFLQSAASASTRAATRRLADAAEEALSSWRRNEARGAFEAMSAYTRALQAFDLETDLGVFEAGHRELVEASDGHRVVYKPCGAGGGDIGMALALEEEDLARFVAAAEARGFERLGVAPDPRGGGLHQ